MEVKALSNQYPLPKSSCKVSLRYLQWILTALHILLFFFSIAGRWCLVSLFVFKLVGMSADKITPKSSLHCLARLFIDLLIWMFVLGALDWSSSCHQQCGMNKKCQILRKTRVHEYIFLNDWSLIWKHSASKIHLPFNGCIHMSTVLSKRVHSLFWCRISPAASSKPYPLASNKADNDKKDFNANKLFLFPLLTSHKPSGKCHWYLFRSGRDQAHIGYFKKTSC